MDIALLVASIALVLVTVAYAIHTRAMAREMRETRLLNTRPRLSLTVHMRGPTFAAVRVTNIGLGPALAVSLMMKVAALDDERPWTVHLLPPGGYADFYLRTSDDAALDLSRAAEAQAVVEIEGTVRDLYGEEHPVTDRLDLASWWNTTVAASQAFRDDPHEVANRELKKLRQATENIQKVLARHLPRDAD